MAANTENDLPRTPVYRNMGVAVNRSLGYGAANSGKVTSAT